MHCVETGDVVVIYKAGYLVLKSFFILSHKFWYLEKYEYGPSSGYWTSSDVIV